MGSKDRLPVLLLGLLIGISLASDFLLVPVVAMAQGPPQTPNFLLLQVIFGCVLAQGNLLAAWLAWSDQSFWQRLARHWTVAVILYLVWALGLAVGQFSQFTRASCFVALSVPLVSAGAQMPLWIARQAFGWRLVRGGDHNDGGAEPLSIRDLMTATGLVAVALALARLAPSPDGKELGIIWVIVFLVATTISTVTLLPASALLMRTQSLQRGMLFAGLYAAWWAGLPWVIVLFARQQGLFSGPPMAFLVGVSGLVLSFAATVTLAAAAVRVRGYRLVWGRRQRLRSSL